MRRWISQHHELNFVYALDLKGKGGLGQCWEAFGEPNCFPVPTLVGACCNKEFFYDIMYNTYVPQIEKAIARIPTDKPIIPFPKIGLGCSRMREFAPKMYAHLISLIEKIQYQNIKYAQTT